MKVGIDLGTTYSLVSQLGKDGQPVLMPDQAFKDSFATPSVVHIGDRNAVVGFLVDTLMEQNPELPAIQFFKRNFGEDKPIYFDKGNNPWYPETIGALVLKKLRFDAENYAARPVESAVITVPAHFNDFQRKAVVNAAALADIKLLGLVEEPVAAALHYGVTTQSHDQLLLVYDLGGGTFDVTVITMNAKGVYVLAKDGLTELGGKEFDEQIAAIVLEQFEQATRSAPVLNAHTLLQLRRTAVEIKEELSIPNKTSVKKMVLLGGQAVEVTVYRRDFERSIREIVEQTIAVMLRCLDGASLRIEDVDALLLVGGSSMVPYIRERLMKLFTASRQKIFFHEPMKAVAFGAAIHASQLSGEADLYNLPSEFRGVTGYHVGIRTVDPRTGKNQIDTLIRKNMPLPSRAARTYYTTSANQKRMVIDLVQYLETASDAFSIGQMVVGPLPSPQQNYPIDISLEYTVDGTIKMAAYDPNTGIELQQDFGKSTDQDTSYLISQRNLVRRTFINNLGG